MKNASTEAVYNLVKKDRDVLALSSDSRNDYYNKIRLEYPEQYLEYGIAEANMIASAAGLASCGKIPFIYSITNFLSMRAFEFIRNDVCISNRNVKMLGCNAGLVSSHMGPTHQGTEELNLFRALPNLLVISPATPIEAREAVNFAYRRQEPVYIRIEGVNEPELFDEDYHFEPGKGTVLREGRDIAIISIGSIVNLALEAAEDLEHEGISLMVINMPVIKPIDEKLIRRLEKEVRGIITLEEHSIYGGLGSAVAEIIAEDSLRLKFKRLGLDGCARGCGLREDMRDFNCISKKDIKDAIRRMAL